MTAFFAALKGAAHAFALEERATTAIEFAVLAPLFFAILFGVIVFGLQYSTRIALTYAAAEGGRAGVSGLSDGERQSLAQAAITNTLTALEPLVDPDNAQVTVTVGNDGGNKQISVKIAYEDTRFATLPFVPLMNDLIPVLVSYYVTDPSG